MSNFGSREDGTIINDGSIPVRNPANVQVCGRTVLKLIVLLYRFVELSL